jgi:hypothetical protein
MARVRVRVDNGGVRSVLRSREVAEAVNEAATHVAATVIGRLPPDAGEVVVDDYTTDRRASSVTIKDVRGRLWEARDGVLTQAAQASGLEVGGR